ncbi:hypothetical protein CHS0354_003288 [Potamilus streckersoni]|uniref:Uncharacterized protein n=1 Tax=Potamilus streckersoni TaxID=2493646 RepID=A0AAE0STT7_9BIVA|nr:hypothetical protein CHS0354_003288 [Potamilus streckersoni]
MFKKEILPPKKSNTVRTWKGSILQLTPYTPGCGRRNIDKRSASPEGQQVQCSDYEQTNDYELANDYEMTNDYDELSNDS